jgi:Flp pilus assembly protein TadG
MSTPLKSQEGFGAIEAMLILIILLLVGFIGFYVLHSSNVANKTLDSSTKANVSTSADSTVSSANGQKYLTISEWGIKVPYNESYTFTYSTAFDSNDPSSVIGLSTDQLVAADSACSAQNGAIGAIQRATADTPVLDDGTTAAQVAADKSGSYSFAHIGNYYYIFSGPQDGCSDNSSENLAQGVAEGQLSKDLPFAKATN